MSFFDYYNRLNATTTASSSAAPSKQFLSLPFIIGLVAAVLVVIVIAVLATIILKKRNSNTKSPKIVVDDEFITNIISLFGGKDNIKSVVVDNGRLNITTENLDLVNLNGIKEIATNGVFVTGSTIKTLFRLNSETIKQAIDKKIA